MKSAAYGIICCDSHKSGRISSEQSAYRDSSGKSLREEEIESEDNNIQSNVAKCDFVVQRERRSLNDGEICSEQYRT
jgi:hypothetical protein